MSERSAIINAMLRIMTYIKESDGIFDDDKQMVTDVATTLGNVAIDINRIADALEQIARVQTVTLQNQQNVGKAPGNHIVMPR